MNTCLGIVLRQCHDLDNFERSTRTISRCFAPSPSLLLSDACRSGTVETLDWIWEASCSSMSDRKPGWTLTNYLRCDRHYYRWQFSKSVLAAAGRGDIAIMEWLFAHFSGCDVPGKKPLRRAAERGHLRVYRYLWERRSGARDANSEITNRIDTSVKGDYTAPTQCVVRVKDSFKATFWKHYVVQEATKNGQLSQCIRDGMKLELGERDIAIRTALGLGDFELAELLLPHRSHLFIYAPWCPPADMVEAMLVLGYFRWNEERAADTMPELAAKGKLALMQQIFQLYSPLQEDHSCWIEPWRTALEAACTHGHLNVLAWLINHPLAREGMRPLKPQPFVCCNLYRCAGIHGHVDLMQYLFELGIFKIATSNAPCIIEDMCEAPLNAVTWLLDHGLIRDQRRFSYAISCAARHGRLDILQLFQAIDCIEVVGSKRKRTERQYSIWGGDRDTFYWAATGGHVAVLDWLQENYPAKCEADAMDRAASFGHLDAVKWLHSNRTEGCTTNAMYNAARNGHFDVVKWLFLNRPESHTCYGIVKAVQYGHLRSALWLSKRCPDFTLSRAHVDFHKPFICGVWYKSDALEMLLLLREVYPSVFTECVLQELRREYSNDSHTANLILGWLDENYPSTKE